jgi:hypothetical protein
LKLLLATHQIRRTAGGYRPVESADVDTGRDPEKAHQLKLAWTKTAVQRMESLSPGHYGYSLFAVSKADLAKLRDLHLHYYRAMLAVVAKSSPNECVGLYCAQLLDLGGAEAHAVLLPHPQEV